MRSSSYPCLVDERLLPFILSACENQPDSYCLFQGLQGFGSQRLQEAPLVAGEGAVKLRRTMQGHWGLLLALPKPQPLSNPL